MEKTELRIGNLVHESVLGDVPVVSVGAHILQVESGDNFYSIDYENISPIPMTTEWLEILGFEKLKYGEYSDGTKFPIKTHKWTITEKVCEELGVGLDRFYLIFSRTYAWRGEEKVFACFSNGHYTKKIQYVHQLQNLYFALTGTELTVKEMQNG